MLSVYLLSVYTIYFAIASTDDANTITTSQCTVEDWAADIYVISLSFYFYIMSSNNCILQDALTPLLNRYVSNTNAYAAAASQEYIGSTLLQNPYPGVYSEGWASTFFTNQSTSVLTWAFSQQTMEVQIGSNTGFSLWYGYTVSGSTLTNYAALIPQSTATCLTYYSPSTEYEFYTSSTTGLPTSLTPFGTPSYNVAARPWFWPTVTNTGIVYSLYYSSASGTTKYSVGKAYYSNVVNANLTQTKSVASFLYLTSVSSLIQNINAGSSATTTGYIMTTEMPTGLLLATSVSGVATNITTYAIHSLNPVIAQTAQYIMNNGINEDTQVYVPLTGTGGSGCYMSVKFFTYGATTPGPISVPNNVAGGSGYISGVGTSSWSSNGLSWTIVSCTTEPYTTSTTTTSSTKMQMHGQGIDIAILVLVFILLVWLVARFQFGFGVAKDSARNNI